MTRCLTLAAVLVAAPAAHAHFVFLLPDGPDAASAVFSDELAPDTRVPVTKIEKTTLTGRTADGRSVPLTWEKQEHAYRVALAGSKAAVVAGRTDYGVFTKGKAGKPTRLTYWPKLVLAPAGDKPLGGDTVLEIVPVRAGKNLQLQVLLRGKPVEGAEVTVLSAGGKPQKLTTDLDGLVAPEPVKGTLGAWVGHKAEKAGEVKGQKYEVESHYATLVLPTGE